MSLQKWIKLIPNDSAILFDQYNRKNYFRLVATVTLDQDIDQLGTKLRKTLIRFNPQIPKTEFNCKTEWIYLFTINNNIVKIGGTRTGLKNRTASYLCGHHTKERGKSGDCSKTNAFIYNTFLFYLQNNSIINMYAYQLPKIEATVSIFETNLNITVQTFHAYETKFLEDFKQHYNQYPILSDNCDPDYK